MTEHRACAASDVEGGSVIRVDLPLADGTEAPVAIVRTDDGRYFAIDDTCSHGAVSLSEGEVVGHEIECWGHGVRFDLATGVPASPPATTPIRTYPTRIDGGDVLVDVGASANLTKEDA
ncbi:MAG: non-heme iron oxygenase ferredoxin subunit [Demequinaceae bacterium]|nr:non-heme iron oxygenase ferredoxin subunit [Demequinaceae bacterium]